MNPILVDAHQDIAWNHFNNHRDYTRSAWYHRRRELDPLFRKRYGLCMVGLPEAILARIAVTFASIFVSPAWATMYPDERLIYTTPQEAYTLGMRQADYYHTLAENVATIDLILTQSDLDAVLATWAEGSDLAEHRQGLVITMEGADPIREPAELEEWYARGLRGVGPAWTQTRYSGGTKALGPLTDLGRSLLEAMGEFNMLLDLAHMAPEACQEAVDRYDGPIIASHANPLRFRRDRPDRNLSDDMLVRLAERDGVIGILPYNLFLVEGWQPGDRKDAATLNTVIAAIDHVCQVTGSARHVGIGSDADGGFGAESVPVGIDTLVDLQAIGPALAARGYAPDDIEAIMSGNFLRQLRAALPAE